MSETSVQCPTETNGVFCGGELVIEWEQSQGPAYKTDKRICAYCEEYEDKVKDPNCETFEGEETQHKFEDEWEDGPYVTELISLKTYCFHVLSKDDCVELLNEEAVAAAERRAERND
jgi:hypothetical protein